MNNISFAVPDQDGSSTTVSLTRDETLHCLEIIMQQLDPEDLLAVINTAIQRLGTKLSKAPDSDSDSHVQPKGWVDLDYIDNIVRERELPSRVIKNVSIRLLIAMAQSGMFPSLTVRVAGNYSSVRIPLEEFRQNAMRFRESSDFESSGKNAKLLLEHLMTATGAMADPAQPDE